MCASMDYRDQYIQRRLQFGQGGDLSKDLNDGKIIDSERI